MDRRKDIFTIVLRKRKMGIKVPNLTNNILGNSILSIIQQSSILNNNNIGRSSH